MSQRKHVLAFFATSMLSSVCILPPINAWIMTATKTTTAPSTLPAIFRLKQQQSSTTLLWNILSSEEEGEDRETPKSSYDLGLGKNEPVVGSEKKENTDEWLFSQDSTALEESPRSSGSTFKEDDDYPLEPPTPNDLPWPPRKSSYDFGIGKNKPVISNVTTFAKGSSSSSEGKDDGELHWYAPEPVKKPNVPKTSAGAVVTAAAGAERPRRKRKMVAHSQEDSILRGAIWHEEHFGDARESPTNGQSATTTNGQQNAGSGEDDFGPREPEAFYPDIDLSIPDTIYSESKDVIWELMRWEAYQEAQREPLLVSFLYSSILNHDSLESSLAFSLANKLSSPAMISTQIQSLILEALACDPSIGRSLRADIMAVRDRDPACTCLPDVFLYFKGFHALQTYRVSNVLWNAGKHVLAHYLQSQMSQIFQIDIHPNSTLGSGIMLDHGTGIVIGETARVGHNCSILHHVTLGGSGKKGVDRHPKVGEGVLLGAGASIIGNVNIGDGCQVGAGTLVISDLPAHSVAVGVPAKIIGSFMNVTEQPSIGMNQMMDTFQSDGI